MPEFCPELKSLLDQVDDRNIPADLHVPIESHLESCRACRADFSRFLKIGNILQRTVYGNPFADKYIAYLSHLAGKRLRWSSIARQTATPEQPDRRRMLILLLKVFVGFLVAAAVGVSLAVFLGRSGLLGGRKAAPAAGSPADVVGQTAENTLAESAVTSVSSSPDSSPPLSAAQADSTFPVPASMSPQGVLETLNRGPDRDPALAPDDSAHLRTMQAELGALREALSRNPRDMELHKRTVEKSREVLNERRRLGLAARVKDYYNLGWAHYQGNEFRQAVLATADGLQTVKIGPTEYLHYLKAMSHYQLASRLLKPLPADTSADEQARLRGAVLRSELDADARRKAVHEMRQAIEDFSAMLGRSELEPVARGWILRLNDEIASVTGP